MTEQPGPEPEPAPMPKWMPVLIGAILVVIAGFAVYTGLTYRDDDTIVSHVRPRRDRANAPAPPGEPGAGDSLVVPGASPIANAPVKGQARRVISGGPQGIQTTERIWARRGMVLNVFPEDAVVYVNDLPIGHVSQFNSMDEV